jgi:hypothetical protein
LLFDADDGLVMSDKPPYGVAQFAAGIEMNHFKRQVRFLLKGFEH